MGADLGHRRRRRERGARALPRGRRARHRDCRRGREAARALERGADAVVNPRATTSPTRVRAITDGRGVDVVVEHVGAATWKTLDRRARPRRAPRHLRRVHGRPGARRPASHLLEADLRARLDDGHRLRVPLRARAAGAAGRVRPVIDSVFPLEDAARAHERLEAGEQFGKIVLRWSRSERAAGGHAHRRRRRLGQPGPGRLGRRPRSRASTARSSRAASRTRPTTAWSCGR